MIEFDCPDCDAHVFAFGLTEPVPPGQRCATCQWLADIPDPAERAKLRVFLAQREDSDG
jgi:hypothetical protein